MRDGGRARVLDDDDELRGLIEAAADVVFAVDRDGRVGLVNAAFERATGRGRRDPLAVEDVFGVRSAALLREALREGVSPTPLLLELKGAGGRKVPLEASVQILRRDGACAGLQAIGRDVTERHRAEEALRASEERFRGLVERSLVGCYIIQDDRYAYVNPKFAEIFGYTQHELVSGMTWRQICWPEDVARVEEHLRQRLEGRVLSVHYTHRGVRRDGQMVELEVLGTRTDSGGRPAVNGTLLDITERKRVERAMRESEERYALAALGANDGLWDWDLRRGRVFYSARWKAMLGARDDEVGDTPDAWFDRVHGDDRPRLLGDISAHLEGRSPHLENEHRVRHVDGTWRWMLVRGSAVRDAAGQASRLAGSQTDITSRKEAEEKLLHDAVHDGLTGLPNRTLFLDRLSQAMAFGQRREEYRFAVLILDIDRFKTVNDSLGHVQGDALLVSVARRLASCVKPGDTVARLGGDEFAVLLEDYPDPSDPQRTAQRLHDALSAPFDLQGTEVFATASVGIAVGQRSYTTQEELVRDADTAMYRAKDLGRARHVVFHPAMHAHAIARLQLDTDLRRALEREELRLRYQPVVSIGTGQIVGCEALLVWQHPTRGAIPPLDFIPVAEETGLIVPLGRWALERACLDARAWNDQLPRSGQVSVSVNLSGKQLGPEIVEHVRAALAVSGLDARRLKLEVTESVIMESGGAAAHLLGHLKTMGVGLLLDDFGTGYSSLAYLHNFRFDTLKIDRSFVSRIDQPGRQSEIVRTILSLARALSMDVVAEGVETAEQLTELRRLQCDAAQGYLFSRPLDPRAFAALLGEKPFQVSFPPPPVTH